jgi:predicted kinase
VATVERNEIGFGLTGRHTGNGHAMRTHYPRTPHLPWSPGAAPDDVRVADLSALAGREVVVTEKLDGENTTLYADGLHARSLDSAHHPSRAWIKALHGRIAAAIPAGWRVCGENLYARHSIPYDALESYFYAFSVWVGDRCLDWDGTVGFARRLGVPVPRVLWRGAFDERAVRALRVDTAGQEGYVVRTADGFDRADFAHRVAKWVRPAHVQTDTHWMLAPVVPNGLGPAAALWEVRSGGPVDPAALRAALALDGDTTAAATPATALADVTARLDMRGRTGDARLTGVLAVLLCGQRRTDLLPTLAGPLGMRLARRVADLVGLHPALHKPVPDERRRAGLVRMAMAADLDVLHSVAESVLSGRSAEREQVEWSALHAEDAGLLGPAPFEPLRAELRKALADCTADAADRCWAEAREGHAEGRLGAPEAAGAYTWRWRAGGFPRLVLLIGPAGSGKSRFAATLSTVDEVVSMDDLRAARGDRADQRANTAVHHAALDRLDAALTGTRTVVWDATGLTPQQRGPVHAITRRRDALLTHAVLVVSEDVLHHRNAGREHAVPPDVLRAQWRRFSPPYPFEAHRTWYVGAGGAIDDTAGTLDAEDD